MLDDLRNSAAESYFEEEPLPGETGRRGKHAADRGPFLGMTPPQRFVLALLVFVAVCMLGAFFLVLTETVWLPIL